MSRKPPDYSSEWVNQLDSEHPLDESMSDDYIGKVVLLGVTYLDEDENVIEQMQWAGKIKTFSNRDGIQLELIESDEYCCIPPDHRAIIAARPGSYRLKSTGLEVENPDYLIQWTCTLPNE